MLKKLLIILMMTLSSIHLLDVQPKTKAEFIKVKGFGEKKYTNLGKEVIQLFKTYKLK